MKKTDWNRHMMISFFALLVISGAGFLMLYRGDDAISTAENRKLAAFPDVKETGLLNWPASFEEFYSDHIPFRTELQTIWGNAHMELFRESSDSRVLVGKSDDGTREHTWLFYQADQDGNPLKEAQGVLKYTAGEEAEMLAVAAENELEIKTRLSEIDARLYYMAGPNKESVYHQYLPDYYKSFDDMSRMEYFAETLEKNGYPFIYPLEELKLASEQEEVYYRQDIHWNDYGAYIGFKKAIEIMNPDKDLSFLDEITVFTEPETEIDTDLIRLSSVRGIFRDHQVRVSYFDTYRVELNPMFDDTVLETRCEDAPIDETIMLVGDSFRTAMIPYFERTYKHCFFMHRWDYESQYLEWFYPDVILLESVERYTPDNFAVHLTERKNEN